MNKIKLHIIIISILISNFALAQNKSREVIISGADTIIKAKVLVKNIKYKPQQDKVYFWYKANKINSNLGGYSGRLLCEYYNKYVNNNLVVKGYFKKGLKHKRWNNWDLSGVLKLSANYKNGYLHGKVTKYDDTGSLIEIENFRKGKLHGKKTVFKKDTIINIYFKKGIEYTPIWKKLKLKLKDNKSKEKPNRTQKIKKSELSEEKDNDESFWDKLKIKFKTIFSKKDKKDKASKINKEKSKN